MIIRSFCQELCSLLSLARGLTGVAAREVSGQFGLMDGRLDGLGMHSTADTSDACLDALGRMERSEPCGGHDGLTAGSECDRSGLLRSAEGSRLAGLLLKGTSLRLSVCVFRPDTVQVSAPSLAGQGDIHQCICVQSDIFIDVSYLSQSPVFECPRMGNHNGLINKY